MTKKYKKHINNLFNNIIDIIYNDNRFDTPVSIEILPEYIDEEHQIKLIELVDKKILSKNKDVYKLEV